MYYQMCVCVCVCVHVWVWVCACACMCVCVCVCVCVCYISLVASFLDLQNAQFNNAKEGNFRSLKDCDKQICYYDENDLLPLKRCRQS